MTPAIGGKCAAAAEPNPGGFYGPFRDTIPSSPQKQRRPLIAPWRRPVCLGSLPTSHTPGKQRKETQGQQRPELLKWVSLLVWAGANPRSRGLVQPPSHLAT